MTEFGELVPAEEPKAEERNDTFLKSLPRLFFKPVKFFERIAAPKKKAWLFLFALTSGAAYAISWAARRGDDSEWYPTTWGAQWVWVVSCGLFGMLIVYFLGGAWYRYRLGKCGVPQADKKLVRLVYLGAAQIYAIPMILTALIVTVLFSDPGAAAPAESVWVVGLSILFLTWSFAASTIGVRTVFKVPKSRAAFWFFILPLALTTAIATLLIFSKVGSSGRDAASSEISLSKVDLSRPSESSGPVRIQAVPRSVP